MGPGRARTRRLLIVVGIAAIALAFVATRQTAAGPQRATGIVVDVEGDLTTVTRFTILSEGRRISLTPVEDGDYAFPLVHLRDHLRTGEPVVVQYEGSDVSSIEDG